MIRKYFLVASTLVGLTLCLAGCNRPVVAGPEANVKDALALREKLKAGGTAAQETSTADVEGPTQWGTLRGVFKYDGPAPTPAKLTLTRDVEYCSQHPPVNESLIVGPDGGLKDVIVYLRTPKVPVNPDYEKTAHDEVVLDNLNCRFEPHVLTMRTTQTLLLKNSDRVGHNSKIDPTSNAGINPSLPAGNTSAEHFPKEETVPAKVGCSIHEWMGGWLLIRKDPYAAVSDRTGEFKIDNLPAGRTLEFQMWQEKTNPAGLSFEGGKTDAKGRFKIKLKPGDNNLGVIKVSAAAIR